MVKLVYSTICSLDGYVADADGDFGWAAPDDEKVPPVLLDEHRFTGGVVPFHDRL